jgi:fatty-acyl-CoA synthase
MTKNRTDIMSIGASLVRNAKFFGNKVAVIDSDRNTKLTYKQFNSRVNKLANSMMQLGIKKGERVAALFQNSPQMLETFWACQKAGMIWIGINVRFSPQEIINIIDDARAVMLLYDDSFAEVIESIKSKIKSVKHYACDSEDIESDVNRYEDLILDGSESEPDIVVGDDDISSFVYTGGTTGKSKGAILTHHVQWAAMSNILAFNFDVNDILLASAPMFHIAGMGDTAVPAMMLGMTLVVTRNGDIKNLLSLVKKEKCNVVFFVPTQAHYIAKVSDFEDYLGTVRIWLTASAPFPVHLYKIFKDKLPNADIRNWYGSTEAISISVLRGEDSARLPSVGKPVPGALVKIVDEHDGVTEKKIGESGEIVVKSPWTVSSYFEKPQETADTFRNGWCHTGDIGRIDDDGYLYIIDRKKDMIITGGENVYAVEVEHVLVDHPSVSEVQVIGVPNDQWGEIVLAVIIKKDGKEVTEEEIIKYARERLTAYKCPRAVRFVDSYPRSAVMKVLKREMRKMFIDAGKR